MILIIPYGWSLNTVKAIDNQPFIGYCYKMMFKNASLILPIGPSGAGKSTLIKGLIDGTNNKIRFPRLGTGSVISTDDLRQQFTGDFRSQQANKYVFRVAKNLLRERLEYNLTTIFDATNLKKSDRVDLVERAKYHCPEKIVYYIVINRPMEEKIKTDDWRSSVIVKGKPLMEYHEEIFQNNLSDILNGDGLENVVVIDTRVY